MPQPVTTPQVTIFKLPKENQGTTLFPANTFATRLAKTGPEVVIVGCVEELQDASGQVRQKAFLRTLERQGTSLVPKQRFELPSTSPPNPFYQQFEALCSADTLGLGAPDVFAQVDDSFYRFANDGNGKLTRPQKLPGRITQALPFRASAQAPEELLVYDRADRSLKLLSFDTAGKVTQRKVGTLPPGNESPTFDGMAVDNFNGDGLRDVLVPNAGLAFTQKQDGSFVERPLDIEVPINGAVSTKDIDGDGVAELAITDATGFIDFPGRVRVYKGTPETGYNKLFDQSANDNHPQGVLLTDVTGDGFADIVLPGFDTGDVFVYRGSANGFSKTGEATHVGPAGQFGGVFYVRSMSDGKGVLSTAKEGVATIDWP
ncbi:MAG: FG-GAP repeat domain-containing protein [Myxococcaceae bacterium]